MDPTSRPVRRREAKKLACRDKMLSKKFKFAAEAVEAQKKRSEILETNAEIEHITVELDKSEEEACDYLSLMRMKTLNCARAAAQKDKRSPVHCTSYLRSVHRSNI